MNRWMWMVVCGAALWAAPCAVSAAEDPMIRRLRTLEEAFVRFRAERDAFEAQLKEQQAAVRAAEAARAEADRRARDAESARAAAAARMEELDAALRAAREELAKTKAADESAQERIRALEAELAAATAGAGAETEDAVRLAAERAKEQKKLQAELEQLRAELDARGAAVPVPVELHEELEKLRARVAELEAAPAGADRPAPPPSFRRPAEGAPPAASANATREDALTRARQLRDEGRMEESFAVYADWTGAHPDDVEAAMEWAELQFRTGAFDAGRATLATLSDREPKRVEPWVLRGRLEQDAGRTDDALEAFQKALALDPRWVPALKEMSLIQHNRGRTAEAIRLLQRARDVAPDDGETCFNLAALLLMSKPPNVREAEQLYRRALMLGEERDEHIERMLSPKP